MAWIFAMLQDMFYHLVKEHPRLVSFTILVSVFTFGISWSVFAQKVYVDNKVEILQKSVEELDQKVTQYSGQTRRQFLLIQIQSMEREIYSLQSLIESGEGNERDRNRLVMIQSEYNEALRVLNTLPVN